MTEHASDGFKAARAQRTDSLMSALIVLLVAAVLGAGALFGYTYWQSRVSEQSATPAQRALQELEAFTRANPNNAAARVRYGEALAGAGLYEQAGVQFRHAVKIDKAHTGAWLDLGMVAMASEDRKNAERYFQKVVDLTANAQYEQINQRREQAFFHLGEIALDDKRFEEAAANFKAALRIRKDASDTYYLLAQSLVGLGKADSAVEQLDASLAFDPNYAEAHYLYGTILLDQNDKVNAAVHLVKAVELAPDAPQPTQALARLGTVEQAIQAAEKSRAAKRFSSAISSVLLARELDRSNVDAVLLHARILIDKGDARSLKAARTVIGEAAKLDPKNPQLVTLRARLAP